MKVFKFGGASLNSVERIQNVGNILTTYAGEPLMLVMSAMGKTTNALEKVAEAFYAGNKEDALNLFNLVKQNHLTTAKYLLVTTYNKTFDRLNSFFTEVEWLLHDKAVQSFDYYYDQVVCVGELLSSCIVSAYLNEKGITNEWIDVRDIIRTDNNFREANICWDETIQNIKRAGIDNKSTIYVTQGFIGSTDQNESTTLGREGSDFTAAIFANLLEAENLTIWKDVEGVMSADPKIFPGACLISELSFNEVIEMAFYGAQVIHPKTIKPLQNKKITLQVKSFLDPTLPGTTISNKASKNLPPVIVLKNKQVLIQLQTIDFSFIGERPISELYHLFAELNIKPNLIQTAAINVQFCVDDREEKIQQLAAKASEFFDVQVERNLTLLTIRHYDDSTSTQLLEGKQIVLTQKTKTTLQALYHEAK
ncbi:aspartate kinase [Segetibacter aerophilus]|uniref:Aspartokinase n=1 Tax=Segetibacter aerophilus TaxID=670293 RepID=A0A512BJA1_9BACT|nr:aspartate kinase [Segetibacter aerophilus]GEO12044.1 aspartokinase [Segetibacter aerophilus]